MTLLSLLEKDMPNIQHIFPFFFLQDYTSGELLTGYLKKELIDLITPIILGIQEKRKTVTEETVELFMTPRPLKSKLFSSKT